MHGWARRRGQDLRAGGSRVGHRSRGIGRLISTTHGIVDKHANNCNNTSASASTNTVKNASASSAIFEQNGDGIHSARGKGGTATTIAKARRRSAASHVATTPAPATLPLPRGGWHARTPATATATMTKTTSKGWCRDNDCRGQEEPAALRVAGALTPPALPLPQGRRHAMMLGTATATMTKTKMGTKTLAGMKMRSQ